jgi:hypothetical protein
LLLGTAATGYAGRISARCVDCGKSIDYYVDSTVEKIWKLDPVESKAIPREHGYLIGFKTPVTIWG